MKHIFVYRLILFFLQQCVKDCASDTDDDECGGLAKRWESTDLYAKLSDCCKRIYWIDEDDCALE